MLLTRVITALCLLLLILPILFLAPPAALAGLMAVIVALAAWEFGRLLGLRGAGPWIYAIACVVAMIAWHDLPARGAMLWLLQASVVAWGVAIVLLARGVRKATPAFAIVAGLVGLVILPAFGHAAMLLRGLGVGVLLSAAALVWAADIGAYFVGKAIGRRKLAPSISPGKSWEGAIGGWLFALAVALSLAATHAFAPTWFDRVADRSGLLTVALLTTLMVIASVVGDLFESLLKRQVGKKDSSRLLPGHGGVLDRIDALLPVLPLAALLILYL
ncbi:phosphatidate cytidylyltransferase [Cupriavidus gilardii]|uniref:Phosphatidate cytidylyltransferase n=1 Tax=Cupriavidus gilardii TaxID=82541 RepID=A0A6N1BZZ6_9BURK|nr:phosphatidate cytidylyltransferase [Cupriavidus gilardii]ALD90402.1 CDP-diglyceride synthase [Cupriavidus gilardii CR3]QQE07882.1 phosphatidate cytidylyltransferase [Cupriavidus sp. ISTL7]KAB0595852.1 phosphatidate cytidylyltransferase [Cupriavidus gilardii]MCT9016299.1 phosphatidate cytidylyltransferase [Cupriavidus gilardii]MCT9056069.1 phosphatidate cytidylyltransferase [Cupriavidus gilardii]